MVGRFSFSTPGYREPSDPWFRVGTVDVTTTVAVVAVSVFSMILWAIEQSWLEPFILWPSRVLDGQIWRLITWPFPEEPDLWVVLLYFIFWMIGSQVERMLGRNRFAVLLLIVTVLTGVFGTLIDVPEAGLRTIELCVVLLFIAEYPFVRFFFGIPGWAIGLIIVGIEFLQLIGYDDWDRILFRLFSFVVTALVARSMGMLSEFPWIPAVPIGGAGRHRGRRPKRGSSRSSRWTGVRGGGDVVAGPWTGEDRRGPERSEPLPQPPRSATEIAADQTELDELLDKISAGGLESLSGDEKRRLNELSKRLRDR